MINRHNVFVLLAALALGLTSRAQDVLQLDDVVKLILENNFDIQVAKNNIQVAENNNNIGLIGGGQSTGSTPTGGSTGMLPQISIQAGSPQNPLGVGQTISTLHYSNPALNVDNQALNSTSFAPSIVATWYFFDGFKMFATKKKLNRLEDLSNLQYRLTVENTMLSVLNTYYQMISAQALIKSLNVSLALASDQRILAEQKLKAGTGSEVDVLQTRIDYNNIQVQIMQQNSLLSQLRADFNSAVKRSPDTQFSVPDTITIQAKPDYKSALDNVSKSNNSILISKKTIEIDELGLKEYKANRYPKIGVTGNYSFSRVTNDIGLQRLNRNYGYNAGFIFSWTILNNLTTNTAIKNQKVLLSSDDIRLQATTLQEQAGLYKAFLTFQNNLSIMDIEKQSVEMAKENMNIASQRFKIGLSNYIEYRTIEQSYEEAVYRLSQAEYNTKLSELSYLKAQGLLIH